MITLSFLVVATAILAAVSVVYEWVSSPLTRIPGPFAASLSRWWLVKYTRKGNLHRKTMELHEKYGLLVRIAPNEISVASPSAIKQIYGEWMAWMRGSQGL